MHISAANAAIATAEPSNSMERSARQGSGSLDRRFGHFSRRLNTKIVLCALPLKRCALIPRPSKGSSRISRSESLWGPLPKASRPSLPRSVWASHIELTYCQPSLGQSTLALFRPFPKGCFAGLNSLRCRSIGSQKFSARMTDSLDDPDGNFQDVTCG